MVFKLLEQAVEGAFKVAESAVNSGLEMAERSFEAKGRAAENVLDSALSFKNKVTKNDLRHIASSVVNPMDGAEGADKP